MNNQEPKRTTKKQPAGEQEPVAGRPPVFSSWKGWYFLVLGNLIMLILVFYWLTLHFSS